MTTKSIGGVKGMRDVPTIQGLNKQSVPATRPQAATEFTRLEHERVRLKRELKIWIVNQKRTEGQLQRVEERLALVQQALFPPTAEGSTRPVLSGAEGRARGCRSPAERADSDEGEAQGWREIPLEY